MSLSNFHKGTTKNFRVTITLDGVAQDITGDVVTFTMKTKIADSDGDAVIQEDADVTTEGADGVAIFSLSPTVTKVKPDEYVWDVTWKLAGGSQYVTNEGEVKVEDRVSDP